MLNNTQQTTVQTTKTNSVKHSAYISVLQAQQQHAQYKHLYTAQQLQQASTLAQLLQQHYANKQIYITARKKFVAVKLSATTAVTCNLLNIAKQYSASIVVTHNNIVLRLFA